MGMTWTEEQKKVIDVRNKNVLVSAAAGSGKTAVLVERILSIVCGDMEGEAPDRKSTRLNSSHTSKSRMPSSA